jgi:hypothetical protein
MTQRGEAARGAAGAAAALVALAACAGAAGPAVAPAATFREVRSLLLVREAGDAREGRPRDPLDGLDETLRARGFTTRVVELGRGAAPGQPALARLFRDLELRAGASRAERIATPVRDAGRDVAATVAELGVDAVATYHRLERTRSPSPPPPAFPGALPSAPPPPARPLGALVLVDRAGTLATFAWGDAGPLEEPGVPLNAAEAIEQLVRALTGEAEE